MGATGLSGDPTEYRTRLLDQSDGQIDAWAAETDARRGDPPRRRSASSRTSAGRPGSTSQVSNGCSLPVAARRRASAATATGHLMVPAITLHALVPGIHAAGHGRPGPPHRVPRRELRGDRLRLRRLERLGRAEPSLAGRLAGWVRLTHPFPSLLDGLATAAIALVAAGEAPTAVRLGVSMTALQASIGILNDVVDAPRDAGHKPVEADPGRARSTRVGPGSGSWSRPAQD